MSAHADVDVFFSTKMSVPSEIGVRIGSVVLHEALFDHCSFSVECLALDEGKEGAASGSQPALDALIQRMADDIFIVVRTPDRSTERHRLDFHGIITTVRGSRQRGGGYRVVLEGFSKTIALDEAPGFRHIPITLDNVFLDEQLKTFSTHFPEIVETNLSDATKVFVDQGMVFHETRFNFMNRIAERGGIWCFYDGEKYQVTDKLPSKAVTLTMGTTVEENALDTFSIEARKIGEDTVTRELQWGDNVFVQSLSDKVSADDLHPWAKFALNQPTVATGLHGTLLAETRPLDQKSSDENMKAYKLSVVSHLAHIHASSSNADVRVATQVTVDGVAKDQAAAYLVSRITHYMDAAHGSYSNEFEGFPVDGARPSWNHRHEPAFHLFQGIVVDDEDVLSKTAYAKDALGFVKVRLTHREIRHIRARVAMPYAGAHSGFFAMPEVGDEVVVLFVEGDPSRAVVVGSLYNNNKSKVFDNLKELDKNHGKGWVTPADNKILIQDAPGKSITISTPGNISINAGGDISITAGGKIQVSAGKEYFQHSVKLTACSSDDDALHSAKNIGIGAEGSLNMTCDKGYLTANTSTDIGKKKVTISGSDSVTLKPTYVSVEVSDGFDVDSGWTLVEGKTAVTLKDGPSSVSVKPDGVKGEGPLIKLNP